MAKRNTAKNQYGYRAGRSTPTLPAQSVGEELERIAAANDGEMQPQHIVKESKPAKAVLHNQFIWNDREAAEAHRLHQARNIINVVTVVMERTKGHDLPPARAFVNVIESGEDDDKSRSYQRIEDVLDDPDKKQRFLDTCLQKLLRIRAEFRGVQELSIVWSALDRVIESIEK